MTTILHVGDCRAILSTLPAESVQCCVTSPPATDLAYAAGVIDSDGSIGIRRSTYAMRVRGDAGQPVYAPRVCLKQVTPQAVEFMKQTFGGSLMMQRPSAVKGRSLHYWEIHSRGAARMLELIRPYLRIKLQQADNCIDLYALIERSKRERVAFGRGHAGGSARDPALTALMEAAYKHGKVLNRVGVAI